MRESAFVRRHAPDWEAFEERLADPAEADADALADGYVRLGDDLAFAQTFYPGSATTAYLNDLQADVHRRLSRNRREERGRLVRFWTHEVPLAAYAARRALALALLLFLGSVALGAVSAAGEYVLSPCLRTCPPSFERWLRSVAAFTSRSAASAASGTGAPVSRCRRMSA